MMVNVSCVVSGLYKYLSIKTLTRGVESNTWFTGIKKINEKNISYSQKNHIHPKLQNEIVEIKLRYSHIV